jgi:hemolysin III
MLPPVPSRDEGVTVTDHLHTPVRASTGAEEVATGAVETEPVRPTWRGRLHQAAFFVAIPAGIALVSAARGTSARVAAAIYACSLVGLFGASAAYHRLARSPRSRRWLKRLDHAMIFVLIAGTATPVALLALEPPWSVLLLVVVWGGAAIGIGLKATRVEGFRVLTGTLYIVLGWAAVLVLPQLVRGMSVASLVLVLTGGVLYTIGAIVLLRNKPDPSPTRFGYHEIWHSMVIGASACHYVAVLLLLGAARSVAG